MLNGAAGDFTKNNLNIEESESTMGNLMEHVEQTAQDQRSSTKSPSGYAKNVSTTFRLLEDHAFIECMDADEVFIITAENRSDRDVKVWDVESGECLKLLKGHIGPITGVKLRKLNLEKPDTRERLVISSSEDGTIRQWSIEQGKEIRYKVTTTNIFTCVETYGRSLVVAGNNKGVLEIYHLLTGQLYTKEKAHTDSIDALLVGDHCICTAEYGKPSSFKVWTMRWGEVMPIYSLDPDPGRDFRPFALSDDTVVLGSTTRQELHFLDFVRDDNSERTIDQDPGSVTALGVKENLVFATTVDGSHRVHLHVYEEQGFEHLLTFHCKNMDMVKKIIVLRSETMLKFVLGGSALKILELDFTTNKAKEADSTPKDPEKILNTNEREEMNDLTKESPSTEKLNNKEDKVTSQATSSLSKLNIEPTPNEKIDNVPCSRADYVKKNILILPTKEDIAEINWALYRRKVLEGREKKIPPSEKDNLDHYLFLKKEDARPSAQLPPSQSKKAEKTSRKAILSAAKFRKEAQSIEPKGARKYTRLVVKDRACGHARKEEITSTKDGEFSGIGAGGEEPRLEKKERHPDCVSDVSYEKSGCFRRHKKKKEVESSKLERRGNKKCDIM